MTTWVLLRGLMRESRHWGEFPQLFQEVLGDVQVVTLDLPGNGCLHQLKSATSVEEMAGYCRAQLRQLGHPPPYNVLALSLGAMVAVAWNELYPHEVERLVLINTSLAPFNPFYHRLRPENYPALTLLLYGSARQRESLILRLTSRIARHSAQKQAILAQWISYAGQYPISRANVLRQLYAAISFRAATIAPSVPVLLLAGKRDQLVNVKCSLVLAQHWRFPIRLHPDAGHDLPLDDGVWVAGQVREWLGPGCS